jgi:HK97 gp10 family phage protein
MQLEGVAELMSKLDALGRLEDGKTLRAAGRRAGRVIVDRARALIPKGTVAHRTYKGRLVAPGFASRSIRYVATVSKDKQKVTVLVGVRAEAFYAVQFVELGTSKMGKQPWLRPAFQSTIDQQQSAIADHLRATIEKIAKGK